MNIAKLKLQLKCHDTLLFKYYQYIRTLFNVIDEPCKDYSISCILEELMTYFGPFLTGKDK